MTAVQPGRRVIQGEEVSSESDTACIVIDFRLRSRACFLGIRLVTEGAYLRKLFKFLPCSGNQAACSPIIDSPGFMEDMT